MADFTTVQISFATGSTDASPSFSANGATSLQFGGTGNGIQEMRWQRSTAGAPYMSGGPTGNGSKGTATTGYASWPYMIIPAATTPVEECWVFLTSDTSGGQQVVNYTGTNARANQFRVSFDNLGTPATAMQFSAFAGLSNATPSPGTQAAGNTDGANIINGQATDTGTGANSYLKGNVYGTGVPTAGQETPSAGTTGTVAVTTGSGASTNASVSPSAAAWLATWQDLQGWNHYITAPAVWKATTAGFWYFTLALFLGPNIQTGEKVPLLSSPCAA